MNRRPDQGRGRTPIARQWWPQKSQAYQSVELPVDSSGSATAAWPHFGHAFDGVGTVVEAAGAGAPLLCSLRSAFRRRASSCSLFMGIEGYSVIHPRCTVRAVNVRGALTRARVAHPAHLSAI
jgi:hypothetical protein